MTYKELTFVLKDWEEYQKDLLINSLAETGFDTFEDTSTGFKAYIPSADYTQENVDKALTEFAGQPGLSYTVHDIPQQNWNEVWESNFEPLLIRDQCYVRASFHPAHPEYPYELLIDPKMAFGTGHHETTSLMISFLLDENVTGKTVLDMGCGTGILAILACKMNAREVLAIDYDPLSYASTLENSKINQCEQVSALCGSKEIIPVKYFDLILANINRNILLDQVGVYSGRLQPGSVLYLSGFYKEPDMNILISACENLDLIYREHRQSGEWVAVKFIKGNL